MSEESDLVERAKAEAKRACKLSDDAFVNENWDDLDTHVSALAAMSLLFSELAAEIERLRAEVQWQPIETAPTDGTHIILFWPQRPPADIGWWTIDERPPHRALSQGFKAHGDKCIPPEQPTHWMHCPLPPPPREGEA